MNHTPFRWCTPFCAPFYKLRLYYSGLLFKSSPIFACECSVQLHNSLALGVVNESLAENAQALVQTLNG